jgi:U3 small nucleolar RNA-associated protein 24
MGKQKKTRNIKIKKMISSKDSRIRKNQDKIVNEAKIKEKNKHKAENQIEQVPTAMFFQYNTQLGPPYNVLIDTNFINFRYS